jgi:RHS repeat-associated protein
MIMVKDTSVVLIRNKPNTWRPTMTALAGIAANILLMAGIGSATAAAQVVTVTYYLTDAQGSVIMTEDAQGNTTSEYDYRPYGAPQSAPQDGPGYTGHVNDPETGLVYMQARYYDSEVARFISVDPAIPRYGNVFDTNRYDYASNNPTNNIDPDGRMMHRQIDDGPMNDWGGWGNQTFWNDAHCSVCLDTSGEAATVVDLPAINVTEGSTPVVMGGPQEAPFFPPSLFMAQEPLVPRPLIESIRPLPEGAPPPELPEDFPRLPVDPSQSPGPGWEWRGPDAPGGSRGAWYNPKKNWTLHPDLKHPEPIKPHWDWVDQNGNKFRIYQAPPSNPPGVV